MNNYTGNFEKTEKTWPFAVIVLAFAVGCVMGIPAAVEMVSLLR